MRLFILAFGVGCLVLSAYVSQHLGCFEPGAWRFLAWVSMFIGILEGLLLLFLASSRNS